jgi:aspartate kinase
VIYRATVEKFGGSILRNGEGFSKIINAIKTSHAQGDVVVVLSAVSGVTDRLISMAKKAEKGSRVEKEIDSLFQDHSQLINNFILDPEERKNATKTCKDFIEILYPLLDAVSRLKELTPRTLDYIAPFGEKLAIQILTHALKSAGVAAKAIDGEEVIKTNDNFGNAFPIFYECQRAFKEKILPMIKEGIIPVIAGFCGSTMKGITTTLGRGGSDFTATTIGAVWPADEIILWKDVTGLMSANPKIISNAEILEKVTYAEAAELAHFGAEVLHARCLIPAKKKDIPIAIKSFSSSTKGTIINNKPNEKEGIVKAIVALEDVAQITVAGEAMAGVPGVASEIFKLMAENLVNIVMISMGSSEVNVTFVVNLEDGERAVRVLKRSSNFGRVWTNIEMEDDVGVCAVVGEGMKFTPGVAGKVFSALGRAGVNIRTIAQGSSELNISFVVSRKDIPKAIKAIHDATYLRTPHKKN